MNQDTYLEAHALGNIGAAYVSLGKNPEALNFLRSASELVEVVGDPRFMSIIFANLAHVLTHTDEASAAPEMLEKAIHIAEELGDKQNILVFRERLCSVLISEKSFENARRVAGELLSKARQFERADFECVAYDALGRAYLGEEQVLLAGDAFKLMIETAQRDQNRDKEAQALANLSAVSEKLGDMERALEYRRMALGAYSAAGRGEDEANTRWNLACLLMRQGRVAEALSLAENALAYWRSIGHQNATEFQHIVNQIRSKFNRRKRSQPKPLQRGKRRRSS